MKLKLSLLILLCLVFRVSAQRKITAFRIGDQIPEISLGHVINLDSGYKTGSILNTSVLKNKLVIIDFWASYCLPCLQLIPRYDSLQQQFAGKVQFVLVTREEASKAAAVTKRLAGKLPCITSDTTLIKLFPHNSIPHEVWIRNGKLVAETFGDDVSASTIQRVLDGGGLSEQKRDDLAFDEFAPLLVNSNGGTGKVLYQSIITPYLAGLKSMTGYLSSPEKIISFALNAPVLVMYHQAYSHADPLLEQANREVLEIPDSIKEKITMGSKVASHEWTKKYGYCYDLFLPPDFREDVSLTMAADLNRFFGSVYGIKGNLEKREVDCLVLSRIPGTKPLKSMGGKPLYTSSDTEFALRNLPLDNLVMELAQRYHHLATPIIDDTGYRGTLDLFIHAPMDNFEAVKQELLKSGLDLSVHRKMISMLVIRPAVTNHIIKPSPTHQ